MGIPVEDTKEGLNVGKLPAQRLNAYWFRRTHVEGPVFGDFAPAHGIYVTNADEINSSFFCRRQVFRFSEVHSWIDKASRVSSNIRWSPECCDTNMS